MTLPRRGLLVGAAAGLARWLVAHDHEGAHVLIGYDARCLVRPNGGQGGGKPSGRPAGQKPRAKTDGAPKSGAVEQAAE